MAKREILIKIYWYLIFLIVALIILVPVYGRFVLPFIPEAIAQIILIFLFFLLAFGLRFLYKKELKEHRTELSKLKGDQVDLEQRLDEAFKYIGKVNIQMQEISDVFLTLEKYPESKRDINFIFKYFAIKILALIDADWVLLRIVDLSNSNTLKEYFLSRGGVEKLKPDIANELILANNITINGWQTISTDPTNLDIKAFCIFPRREIIKEQEVLVKGFISRLEMLFIIYSMIYKK